MITTTPAYPSLIDEAIQEANCRFTLLMRRGESLLDRLGLPAETRFVDSPIRSLMTIKRGRRVLEVCHR